VDGEIAALENEVTSFARLQRRMQVQEPSAELRRRVPVWFWAFDLPYFEDRDLRRVPLRQRKQLLRDGFDFYKTLRYTGRSATWFATMRRR